MNGLDWFKSTLALMVPGDWMVQTIFLFILIGGYLFWRERSYKARQSEYSNPYRPDPRQHWR